MKKEEKVNTIRKIPSGQIVQLSYAHPTEYNNWKTMVSYCNTTYSSDDGKKYSIKKNTVNKSFTISAEWFEHENIKS